jgi:hypothetical protein
VEEIVSVPVSPFQHDVVDELIVNIPKTQTIVIKPLDGGMWFIKNNAVVLHTVIILVNTLLTRIFLPPWHNESSVGVNLITLDAKICCKDSVNRAKNQILFEFFRDAAYLRPVKVRDKHFPSNHQGIEGKC